MADCKNCKQVILDGNLLECIYCGATICSMCGNGTNMICPYCYSDLEYMG